MPTDSELKMAVWTQAEKRRNAILALALNAKGDPDYLDELYDAELAAVEASEAFFESINWPAPPRVPLLGRAPERRTKQP